MNLFVFCLNDDMYSMLKLFFLARNNLLLRTVDAYESENSYGF